MFLETLDDHLKYRNISRKDAQKLFGKTERTLKRWNDDPPSWVLNILKLVDEKRKIPNCKSWEEFSFCGNKLLLPNGDYLTAGDVCSLRFEQINRLNIKDSPDQIKSLKSELEERIKCINSTITINVENSGEVLKSWKVSI